MEMNDRPLIDKMNPMFIALNTTAIHHSLLAKETSQFRVLPEFDPGGGEERKCNTRTITHVVKPACKAQFGSHDSDLYASSPEEEPKQLDNISSFIHWRILSASINPVMAQHPNHQGSFDEDFLEFIPESLIEHLDNSFNHVGSCFAATEASLRFSALLPIGGSALGSSSQSVLCSDSNNDTNDVTNIANVNSVENIWFVDGTKIVIVAMSVGG